MSAPLLTGVVAQYVAIVGKTPSVEIRSRLVSHSKPVAEGIEADSMLASVGRSGAGLVQAWDSIFATASAEPALLALNDSANFKGEQMVTIQNIGKEVETFTTTHTPAGTALTANTSIPDYLVFNPFPIPLTKDYASVEISPVTFTLAPGESKQVKLSFTQPTLNQEAFPVYSGFVNFIGSTATSTLSIPYLGLAASIAQRPVLDSSSQYFKKFSLPALTDSKNGEPFPAGELTFDLSNSTSQPLVVLRFLTGTPKIDISLVPSDTAFEPTIKRQSVASRGITTMGERLVRRRVGAHSDSQQLDQLQQVDAEYQVHSAPVGSSEPYARRQTSSPNPVLFSDVPTNGSISSGTCELLAVPHISTLLIPFFPSQTNLAT